MRVGREDHVPGREPRQPEPPVKLPEPANDESNEKSIQELIREKEEQQRRQQQQ